MSYLGILALLSLLIIVHELGHLAAARLTDDRQASALRDKFDGLIFFYIQSPIRRSLPGIEPLRYNRPHEIS